MKKVITSTLCLMMATMPVLTVSAAPAVVTDSAEVASDFPGSQLQDGFWLFNNAFSNKPKTLTRFNTEGKIEKKRIDLAANQYIIDSSWNYQYNVVATGNVYEHSDINIYSKFGEFVDFPDQLVSNYIQNCMAIGLRKYDSKNKETTEFITCSRDSDSVKLHVGTISNGYAKVKKVIKLDKTAFVDFHSKTFQGFSNKEGKWLATSTTEPKTMKRDLQLVNIESGNIRSIKSIANKAGFNVSDFVQVIGWKGDRVVLFDFNTKNIYTYNVETKEFKYQSKLEMTLPGASELNISTVQFENNDDQNFNVIYTVTGQKVTNGSGKRVVDFRIQDIRTGVNKDITPNGNPWNESMIVGDAKVSITGKHIAVRLQDSKNANNHYVAVIKIADGKLASTIQNYDIVNF